MNKVLEMSDESLKIDLFDADKCNKAIALCRKLRDSYVIVDCDYCNKKSKDIFSRKKNCPFCFGGLKRLKKIK